MSARLSRMAGSLVGSEILKIAADVRALAAQGREICNLTVGDFAPSEFRIPQEVEREIVAALARGETNYPPSDGMPALREAVRAVYARDLGFTPDVQSVVITSGSRPGIYAAYSALLDPGDRVLYPSPSWNNNHYVGIIGADGTCVPCTSDTRFMPTRATLEPHIRGARLLALCSPQNPAGTTFTAESLGAICDLVLEENRRRGAGERPLFLLYDQVYWPLTFDGVRHVHPVGVRAEMAPFTIYVDGVSKSFAATGIRVGWIVAPPDVAAAMSGFLGHVGAWAPKAEQVAVARFLCDPDGMREFHRGMVDGIAARLRALYDGLEAMRLDGLPVEAIAPEGAIYLSARFALAGRRTRDGRVLRTDEDVRMYLLEEAGVAIVPFQAFGVREESGWFRLSVGAVSLEQVEGALPRIREAIAGLDRS